MLEFADGVIRGEPTLLQVFGDLIGSCVVVLYPRVVRKAVDVRDEVFVIVDIILSWASGSAA